MNESRIRALWYRAVRDNMGPEKYQTVFLDKLWALLRTEEMQPPKLTTLREMILECTSLTSRDLDFLETAIELGWLTGREEDLRYVVV